MNRAASKLAQADWRRVAAAAACVADRIGDRLVLVVPQMLGHLGIQRLLDQQLRQLLEQAVLADQVFRLPVVSQQARQQLVGYLVLANGHCISGRCGSFPPVARLYKI